MATKPKIPRNITWGMNISGGIEKKWNSLAAAKLEGYLIADSNFENVTPGEETAIHLQRPFRGTLERLSIEGEYLFGVEMYFALNGRVDNCSVVGALNGYRIGNGLAILPTPWPDATMSNSASNLFKFQNARFHAAANSGIGFTVDGADRVRFEQATVEGNSVQTAFWINSRRLRSKTSLVDPWFESNQTGTGIFFRGDRSRLTIEGANLGTVFSEWLIDAGTDKGSTIVLRDNDWKDIPPIRLGPTTRLEIESSNNFNFDDVKDLITRT